MVDLETELVLTAEVYTADTGDTDTLVDSVMEAQTHLSEAGVEAQIEEVVADKGYHAAPTLELAEAMHLRTYISEPQRKHKRRWSDKPEEYQRVVYNNRRRTKTEKNRGLQRQRSEKIERSFAHVCETGGARRTWLRGLEKVRKRYLMSAVARNLGLLMRQLFGTGTARGLQGESGLADAFRLARFNTLVIPWCPRFVLAQFAARCADQPPPNLIRSIAA